MPTQFLKSMPVFKAKLIKKRYDMLTKTRIIEYLCIVKAREIMIPRSRHFSLGKTKKDKT